MDQRIFYLNAIQQNIRRYGKQAWGTRMVAFAIASICSLVSVLSTNKHLVNLLPIVILFTLWILDGHFKSMQEQYIVLFRNAQKKEDIEELSIQPLDNINVKAMWRPILALPYLSMIIFFSLMTFK